MKSRFFFSLRYKIMIAFFLTGVVFSVVLGFVAHHILEEKLFSELRMNVGSITRMGAEVIDRDAVRTLITRQKGAASKTQVDAVEKSAEYKTVSGQLNFIRDTRKSLIRYVYLVTPTKDPGNAKYLVDADVISLKKENASDDEISHFNSDLDISTFPVMQRAIRDKSNVVEDEYVYDEAFKVNTVSGYAPVMARDGKTLLALLGLDMADIEVQAALAEVVKKSIMVSGLSLLAALMSSIAMGAWVTRGIIRLDTLVRSFAERDFSVRLQLMSNDEIGRLGFSFNHMAGTIEEYSSRLEGLVTAYGRFFPHDILKLLDKKSITELNLGDQIQRDMSVLFSDIRNFTTLSDSMSPKDNFDFINTYLGYVGPEIRAHKGIIDKYIGDAVMALFPGTVEDAIDAALAMQRKVDEFNADAKNARYPRITSGIAVHCGKVMLGTIGEKERMDGTVISDTVNLASRIEGLSKIYGSRILISDTVYSKILNRSKYFIRQVDKVRVAGKNDTVMLCEICDADDADTFRLKKETLSDYGMALDNYYARKFDAAERLLEKVLAVNGRDLPASLFLEKARNLRAKGVPDGWNGVTIYDSKG